MTGSGEGPAGCEDIDSCADDPCDSIALECVDLTAPLDGFLCTCPAGTVGRETGNHTCVGESLTAYVCIVCIIF